MDRQNIPSFTVWEVIKNGKADASKTATIGIGDINVTKASRCISVVAMTIGPLINVATNQSPTERILSKILRASIFTKKPGRK